MLYELVDFFDCFEVVFSMGAEECAVGADSDFIGEADDF